jgi:tetratricopeptide (TPR) repeat protein/transcriptional regulator with XRE-family HTH domain
MEPSTSGRDLAALLRAWRERALLTQEELAERTGLADRTIRRLESGGGGRPRGDSLLKLADALGLTEQERAALVAAVAGGPEPATAVIPRQLPADVFGFVGRAWHLEQLDARLDVPRETTAVVIAAIAGTAGVGKTALAVHWASRVVDRFPDGQLYVDLRGYATASPVSSVQALSLMLSGLGVEADRIPVEVEAAATLYRSLLAGRRVLVLLDNARDAEQVRPLLPGGPDCVVVVTSRDRLPGLVASHGAHPLPLDMLSPAESVALLAWIVGGDRVSAEAEAAAEVAELCGHLPLALRIAAANLADEPDRPIAGYAAALRSADRLAALEVEGDPRATVGAAFDHSYAALDEPARRMFRVLGLVPGPDFDAPAAAALAECTVEQGARLLARLARAHLLDGRAPGRYAFHDLLRQYAHGRCGRHDGAADREAAIGRLFNRYLHGVDAAARLLYPNVVRLPTAPHPDEAPPPAFDDRAGAIRWLEAERDNLVAAARHAAERGPAPIAWLLADALRGYLMRGFYGGDGLAVAEAGVAAASSEGDLRAQASAQLCAGQAHNALGRRREEMEHLGRALELARRAGWVDGQAASLMNLANVHWHFGDMPEAARLQSQSQALYRTSGRLHGEAQALENLSITELCLGRLAPARDHATRAVALFRQLGSRGGEAHALSVLAGVNLSLGRLDDAQRHLASSLTLLREFGDLRSEANALNALAEVHRDAGRYERAAECVDAALALAREDRHHHAEGRALDTIGSLHLRLERVEEAIDHHGRAIAMAREGGARYQEASALLGLAAAQRHGGRPDQAIATARQALDIAVQAGYGLLEGDARTILGAAHRAAGDHVLAVEQARRALALHRATGQRMGEARTLVVTGHLLDDAGDAAGAASAWRTALAVLTEIGAPERDDVRALLADRPGG